MREPKRWPFLVFFGIENRTLMSSSRAAAPSRTSRAPAIAVPAPPVPGSEKVKKMRPDCAKSFATATSRSPPWPRAETFGTPATGSDNVPSALTRRRVPDRSVTIAMPSGRKSMPQG